MPTVTVRHAQTCSPHLRCLSPLAVKWRALEAYIYVRCRTCSGCMRLRQYSWMARAAHEQAFAKKTWFITLTFGPRRRASIFAAATAKGVDQEPGKRLVTAAGFYVSNYFKLLRSRGLAFRYVCVPELHRDGFPHFHGLVHDNRGDLTWEHLSSGWSAGFSVCKIVKDANALRYVTKYLSKGNFGRVRSSLHYGAPAEAEGDPTEPEGEGGGKRSLEEKKQIKWAIQHTTEHPSPQQGFPGLVREDWDQGAK